MNSEEEIEVDANGLKLEDQVFEIQDTPIIKPSTVPEVAILGIGRSYKKQVFIDGKFVPRTMLPLSLSYDHRIIDGAEAAKFNNELKDNLGANFAYNLSK